MAGLGLPDEQSVWGGGGPVWFPQVVLGLDVDQSLFPTGFPGPGILVNLGTISPPPREAAFMAN